MAKRAATYDVDDQMSDELENLIGYNLKQAYIIVQKDFRTAIGDDGLSTRVFTALSLTVRFPNITQSELARMMGIERSGLVAVVDALEQRGLLVRAAVPGDRRVQALIPTDKGRKTHADMLETVNSHEAKLFENFSSEEIATLLSLLKRIRSNESH